MSISETFEPTIENAPCPPFFVGDVYNIFIATAENNSLSENVTLEVWNKCSLQYPYPTTTTTTTTTTPTTTSTTEKTTTPTTTSTTEKITTPTTARTTTTTEKTTTPTTTTTTPTTTTTTEKTTTPTTTTPTTTSPTEKITTPTTATTTTTTEKTTTPTTTTTTTPTTTSTKEKVTTSTTKATTKFANEQTTSSLLTNTARSTSLQTTVFTTEIIALAETSAECDTVCLALTTAFSVGVFVGLFAILCYCANRRRRMRNSKHSLVKKRKRMVTHDKYIQKFPKMSRQADLTMPSLAFVNPTFVSHNVYKPDAYDVDTFGYHSHNAYIPRNQSRQHDIFSDSEQSHYEVIATPRRLLNFDDEWKMPPQTINGPVYSQFTPATKHARHTSIGSHIPKVIPDYEDIYPFGISSYDNNSNRNGLPKINIDDSENSTEMASDTTPHKLPRTPFFDQESITDNDNPRIERSLFQKEPVEDITKTNKNDTSHTVQGLPRIPIGTVEGLPKILIDAEETDWDFYFKPEKLGLPRTELEETEIGDSSLDNNNQKHGLPRTPFEEEQVRDETRAVTKQHGLPRVPLGKIIDSIVDSRELRSETFSLYPGNRNQKETSVYDSGIDANGCSPESNISFASNNTPLYVTKL